ncbi:MAG: hypothetical protein ACJ702_00650 [Nitrososphaeraceae archaeon]
MKIVEKEKSANQYRRLTKAAAKKSLYGQPGQVSKSIVKIIKKDFEDGNANFYPWLHQRINLGEKNNCLTICKILHMTICNLY